MAPRGKNLPLPKPASCSPLPTICGPACCTSCFPEETVLLGTSTRSLTEASVGALGWEMHVAFSRIHLRHSLNLLAPNSARKGGAISCAPLNPMTSHLFMHLTFLSRPHAHWGQAGTSSVWFVRQSLAPVSYRHQMNVQWTECEERCDSSPRLRCAKQHVRSFHDLTLPASQPLGR